MKDKLVLVFLVVFCVLFALDTCLGPGLLIVPARISWELLTGWVAFIVRAPEKIQWRIEILYSVAMYAVLLIVGGHYFVRWLYREMKGGELWRWGWTLRFFLLFILMFAAGTSAVAIVHQTTWIARAPEPMFYPSLTRANRVKCSSNLRQIGQGIELYAHDHQGKYPDDIQQLIVDADINPEVLICPSSNHEKAQGATIAESAANARKDLHYSYLYLGKGLVHPANPELVIAYERPRNHEDDGMNLLFADFHAEWCENGEVLRRLLEKIAANGGKPTTMPTVP